jgi:hypothetical protein
MGLFGDLFSETPVQKQKTLQADITRDVMNVMTEASTAVSASVNMEQEVNLSGVSIGNKIKQKSTIDIKAIQAVDVNAKMLVDIKTKMTSTINKAKTDFPELTKSGEDQIIDQILEKHITQNLNTQGLMRASLEYKGKQKVNSSGLSVNNTVEQENKMALELANKVGAGIISDLKSKLDAGAEQKNTTTSFIVDTVKTALEGVSGIVNSVGKIFSLSPQMIGLFIVVVIVGYLIAKKTLDANPGMLNNMSRPTMPKMPGMPMGPMMPKLPMKLPGAPAFRPSPSLPIGAPPPR